MLIIFILYCVPVLYCMFPLVMITYSVGGNVVAVPKVLLEDEESSF